MSTERQFDHPCLHGVALARKRGFFAAVLPAAKNSYGAAVPFGKTCVVEALVL
jgi:hypothetical protein